MINWMNFQYNLLNEDLDNFMKSSLYFILFPDNNLILNHYRDAK